MQTWYEKHQRSRAAADAKQKAFTTNEADKIHLRDASWESRSVVKITKADIARRIQKRKERLRVKLEERRNRLAHLLESENVIYRQELENSVETFEERRQRMIETAKVLQEKRELARKQEVERIRAAQFKDGLDEFRVLKSKAIKMQCHGGREEQMRAREARKKIEDAEDLKIHNEYMKISQKMLEREIREAEELAVKNAQMRKEVDRQIKIKEEMALAEEEEKQLDVEAWQARLKEANRKEKEKQAKIQQAKEANVQEMFRLNRLNQKRQQEVDAMIEAEEAKFLEQALQLERAAKLKEQQHTAERAAEAKRFQAFLESRAAYKEEDESYLDQVLKDENEAAWQRREAVWEQDRLAREDLKAEVMAGMAQQVTQRRLDALEAEEEKLRVKKELARRNRLLDEAEERKAAAKQKEVDAYRATIGKEIELKKGIRAKEAAKLVEEQQQMALANAKFDANLKAVMGSSYQPPKHYRRKAVKWYF